MAAPPSDFDLWPPRARVLWSEIQSLPALHVQGWVHPTYCQLGNAMARALAAPKRVPVATVRRWLTWLVDRGELARQCIARGTTMPDGRTAWCDHWLVMPGVAMKARAAASRPAIGGGIAVDLPPDRPCEGGGRAPEREVLAGSAANDGPPSSPRCEAAAPFKEDSRLSSLSGSGSRSEPSQRAEPMKLRPKRGEKPSESEETTALPPLSPPVRMLAERLLRHYAEASGVRVAHFRAASRAVVAACLDDMDGDDAAKEMRIRGVIDDALGESRRRGILHPPLAYVFNVKHVRRRLARLAEAEHVVQKSAEAEGGDVFAAGFDRALATAREELAAGQEPTALHQARRFVGAGLVTDEARLAALEALARPSGRPARRSAPIGPVAARRTAQDGPPRGTCPLGRPDVQHAPEGVCGPEDALRALAALFAQVEDSPVAASTAAETRLTREERAELEVAQELARARWARAG